MKPLILFLLFGSVSTFSAAHIAPTSDSSKTKQDASIDLGRYNRLNTLISNLKPKTIQKEALNLWRSDEIFIKIFETAKNKAQKACSNSKKEDSCVQAKCLKSAQRDSWKEALKGEHAEPCSLSQTDQLRNYIVKEVIAPSVTEAIHSLGIKGQIEWNAIGTNSAESDIDIVARYIPSEDEVDVFSKKTIEIMAKILFDLLGVALFEKETGFVFDTESYIDKTKDIENYKEIAKNSTYRNLAMTLSQVQVINHLLHHRVTLDGVSVMDLGTYRGLWNTHFKQGLPLLMDAIHFAEKITPNPKTDGLSNLGIYHPLIWKMTHLADKETDPIRKNAYELVIDTYFPESYFTLESLIYVCYGTKKQSQLFLRMSEKALETKDQLKEEDLIEIIKKNHLINFDRDSEIQKSHNKNFIYMVTALENLGYFFHKLSEKNTSFDALCNASKYLLRLTYALVDFYEVDLTQTNRNPDPIVAYLRSLAKTAFFLERLKRHKFPLINKDEISQIFHNLETAYPEVHLHKNTVMLLDKLVQDTFTSFTEKKRILLEECNLPLIQTSIFDSETKFEVNPDLTGDKKKASTKFAQLLNTIIGQAPAYNLKEDDTETLSRLPLPLLEENDFSKDAQHKKNQGKQNQHSNLNGIPQLTPPTLQKIHESRDHGEYVKNFVHGLVRVCLGMIQSKKWMKDHKTEETKETLKTFFENGNWTSFLEDIKTSSDNENPLRIK